MTERTQNRCWLALGLFGALVWSALLAHSFGFRLGALTYSPKYSEREDTEQAETWAYTDDGESVSPPKTLALTTARSGKWEGVRNTYAKAHPTWVFCGGPVENVHHIVPFHVWPEGELVESNLCSLCRFDHYEHGHLLNRKSWNTNLVEDIMRFRREVETRPMKGKVTE